MGRGMGTGTESPAEQRASHVVLLGYTAMSARLAVALVLWVSVPVFGQSSDLQAAQAAYEASDLDEASARLDAALRSGALRTTELALAHRLLGILAVADGDDERALAEFAVSLALDAEQSTPTELGPEQAALFDGIRAGRAPLRLELEAGEVAQGGRFELSHTTPTAPEGLVAHYAIEASAPGSDPWRVESTGVRSTIEGAAWRGAEVLQVHARALDAYGNAVTEASIDVRKPPPPRELPNPVVMPEPKRSRVGLIVGIVAGVLVVGAGIGVGVWAANRPVQTSIEVGR